MRLHAESRTLSDVATVTLGESKLRILVFWGEYGLLLANPKPIIAVAEKMMPLEFVTSRSEFETSFWDFEVQDCAEREKIDQNENNSETKIQGSWKLLRSEISIRMLDVQGKSELRVMRKNQITRFREIVAVGKIHRSSRDPEVA